MLRAEEGGREFVKFVLNRDKKVPENESFERRIRRITLSVRNSLYLAIEKRLFVIQFIVKQHIDCDSGYLKIFNCSLDQKDMHSENSYHDYVWTFLRIGN